MTAQGGESTIARALRSIYGQYAKTPQWESVRRSVSRKLIIIPSGDQDGTEAGYIRPNWPERTNISVFGHRFRLLAQDRAAPEDKKYFSPEWTRNNISERGPFGALYRVWGDGKQMVKGDRRTILDCQAIRPTNLSKWDTLCLAAFRSQGIISQGG